MNTDDLQAIARAMVAPGKGILAIDESMGTCKKRFDAMGVECTEDTRREYRGLLVSAPEIEAAVSGMILFDETLRQATVGEAGFENDTSFVEVLKSKNIIAGIKVDKGAKALALNVGEKVTEGLDGLRDRLAEYHELGARFAKWRAVIAIDEAAGLPSLACMRANGHALARYAALCQEAGLVPMVEPEILLDGSHSIERCYEVTAQTLQILFSEMSEQGVYLPGAILKVSMVLSGKSAADRASAEEVAEQTVKCLTENVPHDLAGVVFLSGGQSAAEATLHLDLMNKKGDLPWPLSFSYGRAIQAPALEAWSAGQRGERDAAEAYAEAQKLLTHRAKMNGLAAKGEYDESLDQL